MRVRGRVRAAGLIVLAGLVLAGCGDDGDGGTETGGGEPADVTVVGSDRLRFDQETYTATAGTITIELANDGTQPHTLLIEDVDFEKLRVEGDGDRDRGSVDLTPGTYTIYCDVTGHRSAGMEATLVVN